MQSHVSIKVGDNKHWPWVTQCGPNCSHHWVLTLFVEEKTMYLYSQVPVHHNLRSLCQQFSNFYKLHISYSLALYLATTAFMLNAVFAKLQLWFIVAPQTIFRRTTPLLDNQDCHNFVPNKYRIPGFWKWEMDQKQNSFRFCTTVYISLFNSFKGWYEGLLEMNCQLEEDWGFLMISWRHKYMITSKNHKSWKL